MAYELRNTATGEDMRMLHREWELLLVLAERYDWRPAKGRNYARGGRFFHMDAVRMSAALSRALVDIPHSYADGYTEEERLRAAPLRELRAHPRVEHTQPPLYSTGAARAAAGRARRAAG